MRPPTEVVITDVALRDGLQNEPRTLTLQAKRELAEGLIRSGIRSLEVGSFVNPSRVPQMADTAQLFGALPRTEGVEYLALVPNLTGLQRATAAHVSRVRVVLSASEGHSRSNTNRSVDDGIKEAAAVLQRCRSDRPDGQGKQIQCSAAIATAFTCPFDGTVPYEQLRRVVAGLVAVGFEEASLADTLGNANPAQVRSTVARIRDEYPSLRLSLHLHNTYGMALANVQATLEEGIDRYDAALGGIGGCPFAPGAAGNMATEDIVFMLEAMGITTGVDLGSLAQPARQLRAELDRPLDSSVSRALCWVLDDTADHTRQRAGSLRCLHGEPEARAGARRLTGEPPLEGGARLLRQPLGFTMHGPLQGAGRFAHDRGITLADVRIQPGAGSADGDRSEHDIPVVHWRGNGGNAGLAFAVALGPSLLEGLRIASKNAAGCPAVEWQERADGNRCPQFLDRFHRDDEHPAVASPDVQLRGLAGFRCQLAKHRRREQA
jgi:hydroxymethylglutaryl-CoA lyase